MKSEGGDDDAAQWTVEMKRERKRRRRWGSMDLDFAIFERGFVSELFVLVVTCERRRESYKLRWL